MPKKLKVWNGRGYCARNNKDLRWKDIPSNRSCHLYVCAYSREDARRVIEEYCGSRPSVNEARDYWSECWGNSMDGIKPERGLWIQFGKEYSSAPERVI